MELLTTGDGRVVCPKCTVADSVLTRLRGLLGRKRLGPDEGLLLTPANSVHTAFMRFPIDVVFLDRELEVVEVRESVRPWRMAARRGARAVLELGAGEARRRGIALSDRLVRDQRGQSFAEYALLLGALSTVLLAAFGPLDGAVSGLITDIKNAF